MAALGLAACGASHAPEHDPRAIAALLEPPTADEVADLEATIAMRPRTAESITEVQTEVSAEGIVQRVFATRVGGPSLHVAISIPPATGPLPVLLWLGGFDQADPVVPAGALLDLLPAETVRSRYIVVVPCFRGNDLLFHGKRWRCEGDPADAFDGATDDALALLSVTLASVAEADPARLIAAGGSRGGTVALLAAEREPRLRAVLAFSTPTNFLDRRTLDRTGSQYDFFFLPSGWSGDTASIAAARRRVLGSSPFHFASRLPTLELHEGESDEFVDPWGATELYQRLLELGRRDVALYLYPEGHHDLFAIPAFLERFERFVAPFVALAETPTD